MYPMFATTVAEDLGGLLGSFSPVAAWLWKEVGLLLTFIISQPILLLAMSLFFIGGIVSFFMRIYHSL